MNQYPLVHKIDSIFSNTFTTWSDCHRFDEDKPAFLNMVLDEVKASLRRVHEPQNPSCTFVFTGTVYL